MTTLLPAWCALNAWGLTLARLLVNAMWQSALLLGTVGLLAWMLRKRSAALRHALWAGAILLVPLLPIMGPVAARAGLPHVPVRVEAVALPSTPEPAPAPARDMAWFDVTPTGFSGEPVILQMYSRPWAVVILLYALCVLRLAAWFGIGLFRLRRWVRRAVPITDARLLSAFDEARRRLGMARPVVVLESRDVPTPLTLGLRKPLVLLPKDGLRHLSERDLHRIALHECAHIRRHDVLWQRLALMVRTLFFFQPLVWWACRQTALLAEESCDDVVVASTGDALPYADLLARLAERTALPSMSTRMATGLLFGRSAFVRRVEAILDEGRARFRRPSRRILGTTLLAALVCVTLAVAVPLNGEGRRGTLFAEGKVVDEKGSPLADASVYACKSFGMSGCKVVAQTKSDPEGRFRFDGLPSGEDGEWIYMIYAHKPGYAWASCYRNYRSALSAPDRAQGFSDATLTLLPPAHFTGRVLDHRGRPIAGARISAMFDFEKEDGSAVTYWVEPGGESFGTAVSDPEGRFRFDSVPAQSQCRLEVAADGCAMIGINSYWEGAYPRRPFFHVDGKEVELRLAPESRILGSVIDAGSGRPFADITVSAFEKNDLAQVFTTTDADGRFVVKGIPAGTYQIKASVPPKNSYRTPVATVQIGEGEVREGVEFKTQEGVRLEGRVLDKTTGKAIERAWVACSLPEKRRVVAETFTDAQGGFHVVVLPGTYIVGAQRAGYGPGGHTKAEVTEGQKEVRLPDIVIGSAAERNVTLSVLDTQGRPAHGVRVFWQSRSPLGATNVEGRLTFNIAEYEQDPIPKFTFISADGDQAGVWSPSSEEIANPPAQKQITLQKAGTIQGIIRAPDGTPSQNAAVTLWMHVKFVREGHSMTGITLFAQDLQTTTGPDGRYLIRGLVPDRMYDLSAAGPAGSRTGQARHDTISTAPGETLSLPEIILPRAERTVSGRFVEENGTPLSDLRFCVEGYRSRAQGISTDGNGRFEIRDVATEDLRVYITDSLAQRFETREFEIPRDQLQQDVTDVVFTLKRKVAP